MKSKLCNKINLHSHLKLTDGVLQGERGRLDELEMDDAEDEDDEESGRTMLTLSTASDMIRKYKNQPFVLWSLLRVVRNLVRG